MNLRNRTSLILGSVRKKIREAYGCIPNPLLTPSHNASIQISTMPLWYYHSRATNMAFHDLTDASTSIPPNLDTLLGLGLKFCPIPRFTPTDTSATLACFQKDLYVKTFFAGRPMTLSLIHI